MFIPAMTFALKTILVTEASILNQVFYACLSMTYGADNLLVAPGGCRKAEHLEKKKIFGPKVLDCFGQIIFRSTFSTHNFLCK